MVQTVVSSFGNNFSGKLFNLLRSQNIEFIKDEVKKSKKLRLFDIFREVIEKFKTDNRRVKFITQSGILTVPVKDVYGYTPKLKH